MKLATNFEIIMEQSRIRIKPRVDLKTRESMSKSGRPLKVLEQELAHNTGLPLNLSRTDLLRPGGTGRQKSKRTLR